MNPRRLTKTWALLASFATLATLAGACSDDSATSDAAPVADMRVDTRLPTAFGGDRPVVLRVPKSYAPDKKWPLVLLLHGYGANGILQEALLGYRRLVEEQGILLVAPDGTPDATKKQFWNATDACCDFYGSGVDDVAYLTKLIDDISAAYAVDSKRVYLIGHSNGGYMSYRMACDRADRVAAIVSLAGSTFADANACKPSEPVSVLQVHGDKDLTVRYGGFVGAGRRYPGAVTTVEYWAGYNGCQKTRTTLPERLDLDNLIDGDDTRQERLDGCPAGVGVELWTIEGGSHLPSPTKAFADRTWAFFAAHPKP
jgi:polyhydroxybutyrate depolymerase